MKIAIEFYCGSQRLKGMFHEAVAPGSRPTALLLPGLPGNEDDVLDLGQHLSAQGINAMTFNYRGTYESEGFYSIKGAMEDIGAAMAFLNYPPTISKFKIDRSQLVLGGWSFGGGMALAYAAHNREIERIFSVAGTDHGEFARECQRNSGFAQMVDTMFEELRYPEGPLRFEGKSPIHELISDPAPYDLRRVSGSLADRDLLLIGAWNDSNVSIEHHVLPLYRRLHGERAYRLRIAALQDAHDFGDTRQELAEQIIHWIKSDD